VGGIQSLAYRAISASAELLVTPTHSLGVFFAGISPGTRESAPAVLVFTDRFDCPSVRPCCRLNELDFYRATTHFKARYTTLNLWPLWSDGTHDDRNVSIDHQAQRPLVSYRLRHI